MKTSKPERLLQVELRKNRIKFRAHHKINNHRVDLFIKPNIVVEVDGRMFHNYPFGTPKDNMETQWLQSHGYIVLRFWDFEVLNNMNFVIDKIIQTKKPNQMFSFPTFGF